ncbi:MAG: hypothetical protein GY760_10680 [Deltaproteobacteria bacterium]|nr:hypothetical protein [Deltaproteobacteria bacterium]
MESVVSIRFYLPPPPSKIKAGDIVEIQWFNKEGKDSSLLRHIIGKDPVKTGVRLYESPAKPLIRQSVTITEVNGKLLIIKEPLLHDLRGRWVPVLKHRLYLKNVGFEHFRIEFPDTKYAGHHIEDGFNAFYLMDLAHSWVKDVKVHNTDAAVLSSRCKNVTIDSIVVTGRTSHYSVHVSNSYGMLTTNFKFESEALHDPSLNTGAKLCVFSNGHIKTGRLDQHCGLNHQNLFDKITVNDGSQIFRHGGAKNWYPVAGLFNTFWNITINKGLKISCKNAPGARLVGLRGVKSAIRLNYSPNAYIEGINQKGIKVPSLYHYQLGKRLK